MGKFLDYNGEVVAQTGDDARSCMPKAVVAFGRAARHSPSSCCRRSEEVLVSGMRFSEVPKLVLRPSGCWRGDYQNPGSTFPNQPICPFADVKTNANSNLNKRPGSPHFF